MLDDWGAAPLSADESHDLLEVVDDRTMVLSTIGASQPPFELGHGVIADPVLADAILDRLVYNAYKILLTGESMRKAMTGEASDQKRKGP